MTVSIVTDSAASLPADLASRTGVTVVPLRVNIGGGSYRDGELALSDVVRRLDQGVTTSGPSPGEFADAISAVDNDDGVVVLTVSAAMSGTHDAACLAARLVGPKVQVIDTGTAAGAQGLVVQAAARAAAAGETREQVVTSARRAARTVRLVATLPGLDALARSGRVPGAAAWAGRWLGLNPMFEFRGGQARASLPARSKHAALERIVATWRASRSDGRRLHMAALHALTPERAEWLLETVRDEAEPASAFIGSFSSVMIAHTGPGLAGLAWWWEAPRAS